MFLTVEQAESRLNDPDNLVTKFGATQTVVQVRREEFHRVKDPLPVGVREQIAADAIMRLGTADELAEEYGVHPSTVREIKRAAVQTSSMSQMKEELHDLAVRKTFAALGYIDDDKLSGASAKDTASIAASLTKIVVATAPKEAQEEQVKLLVYAPENKSLSAYKVVDI